MGHLLSFILFITIFYHRWGRWRCWSGRRKIIWYNKRRRDKNGTLKNRPWHFSSMRFYPFFPTVEMEDDYISTLYYYIHIYQYTRRYVLGQYSLKRTDASQPIDFLRLSDSPILYLSLSLSLFPSLSQCRGNFFSLNFTMCTRAFTTTTTTAIRTVLARHLPRYHVSRKQPITTGKSAMWRLDGFGSPSIYTAAIFWQDFGFNYL